MKHYRIPMTPGPVQLDPVIFPAYAESFGAGYIEDDFFELYADVSQKLQSFLGTRNEIIIQSGEAMAILWGALKSCLQPGDRLLCINTGIFGEGFADMGRSFGVETQLVSYGFDETIHDPERIEDAIRSFNPKAITAVHCETPSGTLNPLQELGELKKKYQVPLLIVDAVSSTSCVEVCADRWNADIVMGGSQKGLSLPPTIGFCSVSEAAWEIIRSVQYAGYEAFLPWHDLIHTHNHPNTPDWNGIEAMRLELNKLLAEGLPQVFKRHAEAAALCRNSLAEMGYKLFPKADAVPSPSVTAAYIPEGQSYGEFDQKVRAYGMGIGGSFGPMEGKIFRLGHMGTQATLQNVRDALEVLRKVR